MYLTDNYGMKASIITLLFILSCPVSNAQSRGVIEELWKVRDAYLNAKHFSADVTASGYNRTGKTPVFTAVGTFRKNESGYYSRFMNDELISNKNCTVIIDHYDKSITWFDPVGAKAKKIKQEIVQLDSLMQRADSVISLGTQNGLRKFSIYEHAADIVQTDLFIDPVSIFIKRIVYYYRAPDDEQDIELAYMEITYKNISTANIPADKFSEKKCIDYRNGKPVPTGSCSGYELTVAPNEKFKE